MEFDFLLKEKTGIIEDILKEFELPEAKYTTKVREAVNYSMLLGGKRLRPLIMMETWKLWQQEAEPSQALKCFCTALEMIHNQSLIHDDMPCMDNDDYRRGRETTHVKFGEAEALLAGDCLLNLAMETALKAFDYTREKTGKTTAPTEKEIIRALGILFGKSGINGMLGGQCADKMAEGLDRSQINKELVDFIHLNKTAALLEAAFMVGGILAGAGEPQLEVLETIGTLVGAAFQIRDDILDITGSFQELGKPIGSDEAENKVTYTSVFSIEECEKRVSSMSKDAINLLEFLPGDKSFIGKLIESLVSRKR